jgi:hypothetical protein
LFGVPQARDRVEESADPQPEVPVSAHSRALRDLCGRYVPAGKLIQYFILLLLMAVAGCQSGDYNHYTAPEVTGRVLAADTHQPLANVHVLRGGANNNFEPFGPPKGGQLLIQPAVVLTDAAGRFVLESKSVFALFRRAGWWSAPVTYQLTGYESFSTNYTASNVISNTAAGPPVVAAGDVLLQPVGK